MPCFPRKLLRILQKVKESLEDLVQMDSCAHYVSEVKSTSLKNRVNRDLSKA